VFYATNQGILFTKRKGLLFTVYRVPITFIDKYNPGQFEILGITDRANTSGMRTKKYTIEEVPNFNDLNARSVIKIGNIYKAMYARLLIKKINK